MEKARDEGFTAILDRGRPVLAKQADGQTPAIYTSAEPVYPTDLSVSMSVRHATPKGPLLHDAVRRYGRRVPMSVSNATSKKRVGALATVRSKVAKRLMAALHLIATRGADVVDGITEDANLMRSARRGRQGITDAKPRIITFDEEDAGTKWSLQGTCWSFFFL